MMATQRRAVQETEDFAERAACTAGKTNIKGTNSNMEPLRLHGTCHCRCRPKTKRDCLRQADER